MNPVYFERVGEEGLSNIFVNKLFCLILGGFNNMDFRQFDYFFKKRLRYFGFRYMRYLQDYKPAVYERLSSSMEAAHIFETINAHCQFEMEMLMLSLKAGKNYMNPHKIDSKLGKLLYQHIVKSAQDVVFDNLLDVMKYARWM